jgi:hypothetical protein
MQAPVELPKAFSVRDDRELPLNQDLMARLNPRLLIVPVATGLHFNRINEKHRSCSSLRSRPEWFRFRGAANFSERV